MTAFDNIMSTIPGVHAGADYSAAGQYKFVTYDSTVGEVKVVDATTDVACGVLQDTPKSGEAALVANGGFSKVIAGTSASWIAGGPVGWNSTGQAVPVAASATRRYGGFYQRQEASVVIGQLITIALAPGAQVN